MKKSFVSLLTIAAITFGMVSCNSSKKQDAAEQKVEEEAAIAGEVSKGLLTAELKDEVTRFLKDMPDSELPYKVSTGEVTISVANTDFMLPVSYLRACCGKYIVARQKTDERTKNGSKAA